jgi:hypothetical protein
MSSVLKLKLIILCQILLLLDPGVARLISSIFSSDAIIAGHASLLGLGPEEYGGIIQSDNPCPYVSEHPNAINLI